MSIDLTNTSESEFTTTRILTNLRVSIVGHQTRKIDGKIRRVPVYSTGIAYGSRLGRFQDIRLRPNVDGEEG